MSWRPGLLASPLGTKALLATLEDEKSKRFLAGVASGLQGRASSEEERYRLLYALLAEGTDYYFRILFACWRTGYGWEQAPERSLRLATDAMKHLARFFLRGFPRKEAVPLDCTAAVNLLGNDMVAKGQQQSVLLYVDEVAGLLADPLPPPLPLWEMEFCCLIPVVEDHCGSFAEAMAGIERDVVPWVLGLGDPLREWAES